MLKKINKFNKKYLFIYFIFFFSFFNLVKAEVINKIEVTGNERISDETIILFSGVKIDQNINQSDLNNIIKKLYETSFFENISIDFENNILFFKVKENPLIQSISFEGIKNKSLISRIKDIILQKEKSSFVESKIKSDQDRILNSLRVSGYYFSDCNVK